MLTLKATYKEKSPEKYIEATQLAKKTQWTPERLNTLKQAAELVKKK